MKILNLFSREIVNSGRQSAIDLCKTICIILMILCHVFYVIKYTTTATLNPTYIAHNVVRLFGAQFFMFSMGLGLAYTSKNDAKSCFKRGINLFLTGYLLNFLNQILPWMVIGSYPMFAHIMTYDKLLMLLSGDILQFAGLAFLFFALVKYLNFSNFKIVVTALILTVIGAFCTNEINVNLSVDNIYYCFIGLFIPIKNFTANDYVCFSFCNWIIYPVAGLMFGKIIRHCNNLDRFYLYLLGFSLPALLLAWASFDAVGQNLLLVLMNSLNYHQQNPVILSIYMIIIAVAVSFAHIVSKYLVNLKLWAIIKHFSKELPTLYIVSWVIIGWIGAWLKYNHTSLNKDFDNVFCVFIFVLVLSEIYIYCKNKYRKAKEQAVK